MIFLSFIGKSFGSRALEQLHNLNLEKTLNINSVYWITPFKNTHNLVNLNLYNKQKEFFYVGTKDPYYIEEIYTFKNKNAGMNHKFNKQEIEREFHDYEAFQQKKKRKG